MLSQVLYIRREKIMKYKMKCDFCGEEKNLFDFISVLNTLTNEKNNMCLECDQSITIKMKDDVRKRASFRALSGVTP